MIVREPVNCRVMSRVASVTTVTLQPGHEAAACFVAPVSGILEQASFLIPASSAVVDWAIHALDASGLPVGAPMASGQVTVSGIWEQIVYPGVSVSAGSGYALVISNNSATSFPVRHLTGGLPADGFLQHYLFNGSSWSPLGATQWCFGVKIAGRWYGFPFSSIDAAQLTNTSSVSASVYNLSRWVRLRGAIVYAAGGGPWRLLFMRVNDDGSIGDVIEAVSCQNYRSDDASTLYELQAYLSTPILTRRIAIGLQLMSGGAPTSYWSGCISLMDARYKSDIMPWATGWFYNGTVWTSYPRLLRPAILICDELDHARSRLVVV